MDVPSRFKKISEWLEETDNQGDIELYKNDETGIALLYLNNPEKRNALTGKMISKFSKLITELETWKKGKAIIVYGARNFFCSGLNLNLVKQIIGCEWHSTEMALLMSDNFRRLRKLSLLTIALVEKKALGGGAEFSVNLDMRLMTENAQIGFVHKKIGISTAWCGTISLTNLLGPFKAIEILLSARLIGAEEAYQLGLANYVINSNQIINSNIISNDSSNVTTTTTNHLNQSSLNTHSNAITQQQQQQQQVEQQTNQLEPVKLESSLKPINLPAQLNVSNENRTNYCKRIFKRLKKKNDYKEDKLTKRCKLDLDNSEKLRMIDKLMSKRMEVDNSSNKPVKKCNESSKMFKKMKRILFDVEEKFVIKPEIEMSSCSEDDELDKIHTQQSSDNHHPKTNVIINKTTINDSVSTSDQSMQIIPDGQPNHKVGLSDEDDNTILNLVYNWLARLTACLEQDSWSELKQLVRDPKSESNDLLRFINHKTSQIKCNFMIDMDKNKKPQQWQVLKSINSVANQTV